MPDFRLFLPDEGDGITHWRRNNGDGTSTYVARQDVEEIVSANREQAKEDVRGTLTRRGKWGHKIGCIPLIFLNQWAEENLDPRDPDHAKKMQEIVMRKLNDPDFRDFKTANIRL